MAVRDYLNDLGTAKDDLRNIANTPVGEAIKLWAEENIQSMKDYLANDNRVASRELYSSLGFEFEQTNEGLFINFLAADYWDFINQGVNGLNQNRGSEYSFRTPNPSPKMVDAFTGTGSLRGWMAQRQIKTLSYFSKDGEPVRKVLTTDQDFRQAGYVIARAVKRNGIRSTPFLTDTFTEENLQKLEDDIAAALATMIS